MVLFNFVDFKSTKPQHLYIGLVFIIVELRSTGDMMSENEIHNEENAADKSDNSYDEITDEDVKSLIEENNFLKERNESLENDIKRIAADFDNYQKRMKNESSNIKNRTIRDLLIDFSSLLSSFDLALSNAKEDDPLSKGVKMLRSMYISLIEKHGGQIVDPLHDKFDYQLHEAIGKENTLDVDKDNLIIEVYEKGLKFRDIVIKPAKVKILTYEGE